MEVMNNNYGYRASMGTEISEDKINRNIQGTEVTRILEKVEVKGNVISNNIND